MRRKLIVIMLCCCSIWMERNVEAYVLAKNHSSNSNVSNDSLSQSRLDRETSEVIRVRDDTQFDDEWNDDENDDDDGEIEDEEEFKPGGDDNYDDDKDDDESFDPSMYIRKVQSKGDEFTGTLIDSRVVVSSVNSKSPKAQCCDVVDVTDCTKVEKIDVFEDIAYLRLTEYNPKPLFTDKPSKDCKAVGITHETIDIKIKGKEIKCEECNDFDAVVCGKRLAGILRGDRKFHLIKVDHLRDKAGFTEADRDEDDLDLILQQEKNDGDQQYKDTDEDWLSVRKSDQSIANPMVGPLVLFVAVTICSLLLLNYVGVYA